MTDAISDSGGLPPDQPPIPDAATGVSTAIPPDVDETSVLTMVQSRWTKAWTIRQPIHLKWREYARQYNLQFDWSEKRPDQSKHAVAELATTVDFKADSLTDALIASADQFFAIEAETDEGDIVAPIFTDLVAWTLERERFVPKLNGNLVPGQLTDTPLFRVYPDEQGQPFPGYARIECEHMERFFRDPTGRDAYVIHVTPHDHMEIVQMAEGRGWDMTKVDNLRGAAQNSSGYGIGQVEWQREWAEMASMDQQDGYRSTVFLLEYWGPVYDGTNGHVIYPMARVAVANWQTLLEVTPDPFGDGGHCFVDGALKTRLFRAYAKASIADAAPMAELQTRMVNAMADNTAKSIANVYELNDSVATGNTTKAIKSGMKSGQVFTKSSPEPLLQEHPLAEFHPEILGAISFVDQKFQKYSATPDLVRGLNEEDAGNDRTATGDRIMQGNASKTLLGDARRLEQNTLEPLITRMVAYLQTFGDPGHPLVQRIARKSIAAAVDRLAAPMVDQFMAQVPSPVPPAPTVQADDQGNAYPGEPDPADVQRHEMEQQQYAAIQQGAVQAAQQQAMMQARQMIAQAWHTPMSVRVRGVSGVLQREGQNQVIQQTVSAVGNLCPAFVDPAKTSLALMRNAGLHAADYLVSDTVQGLEQAGQQYAAAQQQQVRVQLAGQLTPAQVSQELGQKPQGAPQQAPQQKGASNNGNG